MWVADMDFVSPPAVIEALQKRVAHGVFGYPMVTREMKEVVIKRMAERYNWLIEEPDILFVPCVVPGFNLVCQAFAGAGDSILCRRRFTRLFWAHRACRSGTNRS